MFLGSLGTVTMDIYLQSFTKCIISSFKKYLESEHCVSPITLHAPSYHQLTPYFPVLVLLLLVTLSLPMSIVFVAYQEEILPRVQSPFLCLHSLMISHLIQSETLKSVVGLQVIWPSHFLSDFSGLTLCGSPVTRILWTNVSFKLPHPSIWNAGPQVPVWLIPLLPSGLWAHVSFFSRSYFPAVVMISLFFMLGKFHCVHKSDFLYPSMC